MAEIGSATLSDGSRAVLETDSFSPGSYQLVVSGTPQSQLDPDRPRELFFEYVRRIGHLIDLVREPGEAITAIHLGAGAMSLPRYVEATRPGSRQQVIEIERALVDLVREHFPLPRGAAIRVRYGDAREVLTRMPAGLAGQADLVVVDVFAGAQTPGHITSVEFYAEVARMLAPDGVVVVNVADGPGLAFARKQVATLQEAIGETALLAETGLLKGSRFGNVVLAASRVPLPLEWMPRLLAGGPHPAKVVAGAELRNFVAGASPITDADAQGSPAPAASIFSKR